MNNYSQLLLAEIKRLNPHPVVTYHVTDLCLLNEYIDGELKILTPFCYE